MDLVKHGNIPTWINHDPQEKMDRYPENRFGKNYDAFKMLLMSPEKHYCRNRVVDAVKTHAYRAYYSDNVDFNIPKV